MADDAAYSGLANSHSNGNESVAETSGSELAAAEVDRPEAPTPTADAVLSAGILCVGSANLDEVFSVANIVRPSETISSTHFIRSPGGKGSNQSISAARAGAAIKFCGAIGVDGGEIQRAFEADGVQTDFLHVSADYPTGRALIQVDQRGENAIVISAGANYIPDLPLPPMSTVPIVLLQNEIPLERTISVIREAAQAGTIVVFNPSPLPSRAERSAIPWELVDFLIVNEREAPALGYHVCTQPGACITTFGRRGSQIMLRGSQDTVYRPAGVVGKSGVVDSTGAGDCFTGYLAALLLKLPDPRKPTAAEQGDLLTIANQAAAMSVEKKGCIYGVPLLYQVRERMGTWPAWAE